MFLLFNFFLIRKKYFCAVKISNEKDKENKDELTLLAKKLVK
jgi:hypothetical protein